MTDINLSPPSMISPLVEERQPCYYANSEVMDDKIKWSVGREHRGDASEYSIVVDNSLDNKSLKFACTLIEKYRVGGDKAVGLWLDA